MSNVYGQDIRVSIFGESHGRGIGVVIDGLEPGLLIDMEELRRQMKGRAPGQKLGTTRTEADEVEILSGIREQNLRHTDLRRHLQSEYPFSGL